MNPFQVSFESFLWFEIPQRGNLRPKLRYAILAAESIGSTDLKRREFTPFGRMTASQGIGKMGKTVATLAVIAFAGVAHANTFHYSCRSNNSRYALTVNTDRRIVKLVEHGGSHTLTTFQILKVAASDVCAKYGWILNGATFCIATQGVAISTGADVDSIVTKPIRNEQWHKDRRSSPSRHSTRATLRYRITSPLLIGTDRSLISLAQQEGASKWSSIRRRLLRPEIRKCSMDILGQTSHLSRLHQLRRLKTMSLRASLERLERAIREHDHMWDGEKRGQPCLLR